MTATPDQPDRFNPEQPKPEPSCAKAFEPERFRSAAYLDVLDDTASEAGLHISESCLTQMCEQAEAGYPLEICGLLIGQLKKDGWHIDHIRAVRNLNQERAADRFQLDPAAYQAIDRELRGSGNEIIGVYHSHPDCPAKPSPTDLESAWEGFAYPIISVCEGSLNHIRCWCINEAGEKFQSVDIEASA